MFDAGRMIFDVQRRLGHHSPVLAQEIYTHLMRERYDEGRNTMETYIERVMDRPDCHDTPTWRPGPDQPALLRCGGTPATTMSTTAWAKRSLSARWDWRRR
jgi:hypothetical protein